MISDVLFFFNDTATTEIYTDFVEKGWSVTMADTGEHTMTGARIKRIEQYLGDDEEFLLTYGDGVGNIDIGASIKFHRASGRILTLTGVRPPGRWGELQLVDGVVTTFFEKPQTSSGLINGGFFVADRGVFKYLNDDPALV